MISLPLKIGEKIKARKKTSNKWFETQDSIAYWDDFFKPKIVWTAVNSEYRFCKVPANIFLNNSLFMITGEEKLQDILCSILNSDLYQYYFNISLSNGSYAYGSRDYFKDIPVIKDISSDNIEIIQSLITSKRYQQINDAISELYHLSVNEIKFIRLTIAKK